MRYENKRGPMSNLHQATVKLILEALHSTNLTIESFVIMAISTDSESGKLEGPSSSCLRLFLDSLLWNDLIRVAVSNCLNENIQELEGNVRPSISSSYYVTPT